MLENLRSLLCGEDSSTWSVMFKKILLRDCWEYHMAWLLILITVILPWLVSLCKILHTSCMPRINATSCTGEDSKRRNILFVIAHPDDETMFFSPVINYMASRGHNLHILCMSTGNADQLGDTRKEELYQACAILRVPLHQVRVLDHPNLQDGFVRVWNHDLLARLIKEEVISHDINLIISFDKYGVSGHCNHRDVHFGIRKFILDSEDRNVEAWELVSKNILRKYIGPIDIWLSMLYAMHRPSGQLHCLLNEHPRKSYVAMSQHRSQWVWFRKLFVIFSSYTYVNSLRKIND